MEKNILYCKDSVKIEDIRDLLQQDTLIIDQLSLLAFSGKTGYNVAIIYNDKFGRNLLVSQYGTQQLPDESYTAQMLDGLDGGLGSSGLYDFRQPLDLLSFDPHKFDFVIKCKVDQTETGINIYMEMKGCLMTVLELGETDQEIIEYEKNLSKHYHINEYELKPIE